MAPASGNYGLFFYYYNKLQKQTMSFQSHWPIQLAASKYDIATCDLPATDPGIYSLQSAFAISIVWF